MEIENKEERLREVFDGVSEQLLQLGLFWGPIITAIDGPNFRSYRGPVSHILDRPWKQKETRPLEIGVCWGKTSSGEVRFSNPEAVFLFDSDDVRDIVAAVTEKAARFADEVSRL